MNHAEAEVLAYVEHLLRTHTHLVLVVGRAEHNWEAHFERPTGVNAWEVLGAGVHAQLDSAVSDATHATFTLLRADELAEVEPT